jgi:Phospholipase_D-nuclease N-terminal
MRNGVGVGPIAAPVGAGYAGCMNLNYLLSVIWFILWIVSLVDCIKSNNPNKLVWIVVIILLPFLGSILYLVLGRTRTI